MKKKDFHRFIEAQDPDRKAALYEKTKEKLNIAPQPAQKPLPRRKIRIASLIAASFVCVLSLSIALPIALRDHNSAPPFRYSDHDDYVQYNLDYDVKEYAQRTGKNILSVTFDPTVEERATSLYASVDDPNDMIFLNERIMNGETGEYLSYFITDNHTEVDILQWISESCHREQMIKGVKVKWSYGDKFNIAKFTYGNFIYYFELDDSLSETSILKKIEAMLP